MLLRLCWVPARQVCSGLRGLGNHCLSCCVNTLLQTFSATWELGELLDKWETAHVREEDHNVPLNLRRVLVTMRSDRPLLVPHRDFLACLEENGIRRNTQHDADQVFLFILDVVFQQIDNSSLAVEVQNLYKIFLETHLQCCNCGSAQITFSHLLNLQLPVKEEHDSLEGCLTTYFELQELRGENCCFCPKCGRQTPSKWGAKLLSLPQILCISFKRFRASRSGTRKLDCRVTFPESFDFAAVVRDAFAPSFPQVGASLPSGWCACPSKTIVITAAEPLHLQAVRSCGAFRVGHVWTLHSLRPPSIRSTLVSRQRQPRETGSLGAGEVSIWRTRQRRCLHADVPKRTQRRAPAWSLRLIGARAAAGSVPIFDLINELPAMWSGVFDL